MKISPTTADKLSGWAEEFYNPDLPYHNWGHAEEVIDESRALLNQNGRWTRHVNRPLLQIAAAWHDAGHDHDERFAHESAEHYSVHLMRQRLKGLLPDRQLLEAEIAILGTRYKAARETMAAVALHYGDVGNMSHEHGSFHDHTVRLWREYGQPNWGLWRANAAQVIETTADEAAYELPLIGANSGQFETAIRKNLDALVYTEEPLT
mgnify:FL=1